MAVRYAVFTMQERERPMRRWTEGRGRGKGYLAVRSAGKGSMPLWGQPRSGSLTIHPNGETSQAASEDSPHTQRGMPGLAGAEACPQFSILLS